MVRNRQRNPPFHINLPFGKSDCVHLAFDIIENQRICLIAEPEEGESYICEFPNACMRRFREVKENAKVHRSRR